MSSKKINRVLKKYFITKYYKAKGGQNLDKIQSG